MSENKKQIKPVPDVEALRYKGTPEKPDIKIFVSHRIDLDSKTIDNSLYIPVRCGAVYDDREEVEMLGDDTGDNVSEKRNSYCELTIQYWAWKNIKADYYGLCHYRRYLSFAGKRFPESIQNLVIFNSLSSASQTACGLLDENKIIDKIKRYDVVVSQPFDVAKTVTPGGVSFSSVRDYWYKGWGEFLIKKENLDLLLDLIVKRYPSYKNDLNQLLDKPFFRGYNCFVMKKEAFFDLCSFEFGILEEIEPMLDMDGASNYRNRTLGYFGEILYTLWVYRTIKYKKYTVNERQLVLFQDTSKVEKVKPVKQDSIPIVLNASTHNTHVIYPCLQSILANTSKDNTYEVIVLLEHNTDFPKTEKRAKELLSSMVDSYPNVSIRFLDPKEQLDECDLANNVQTQCNEQEVYRLLMPWILDEYAKVIVLNGLSIVGTDMADLYGLNLNGKSIGAVRDVFYNGSFYSKPEVKSRAEKSLKKVKAEDYFDLDVMLMDLSNIRRNYKKQDAIDIHWKIGENYSQADVLNLFFHDDVTFISPQWNYLEWSDESFAQITKWADEAVTKEYTKVKKPFVRNFKFWDNLIDSAYSYEYWKYARETPVYETLLGMLIDTKANRMISYQNLHQLFRLNNRTGVRKVVDKLAPYGTKRRGLIHWLVPRDSLRWKFCKQIYFIFRPKYRPKKVKQAEDELEEI